METGNPGSVNMVRELEIESNINLADFTTLRIGGPAEWFAEPKNTDEVKQLITWANVKDISCQVIGAGSNILINDFGLHGLTLCMKKLTGSTINPNNGVIEALAGEPIPRLARRAAQAGLKGLEWAVGIPGTIGGAVAMNAGAQGGCIADSLISTKVLKQSGGEPFEIAHKDLSFSYRNSILQNENLIVLSAKFQLKPGQNPEELMELTKNNLTQRTKSQPYHLPSCGSVFRNPEPQKAGKIIEDLGLKGYVIGEAEISKIHANFIVNLGKASSKDVQNLITTIQKRVHEAHGLTLRPEVKQLGFDSKLSPT